MSFPFAFSLPVVTVEEGSSHNLPVVTVEEGGSSHSLPVDSHSGEGDNPKLGPDKA